MQGLDRTKKEITLSPIADETQEAYVPERKITYDILVLAVGSVSNDFNISGVRENCLFLDNTEQAKHFHQILIKTLMQLPYKSEKKLGVAIVGGGATGVELAAELHYAIHQTALHGMDFDPKNVSISLIEAGERLLPALSPHLSKLIMTELKNLGIHVHTHEQVEKVTAESLITRSGKIFPADIKVWAAGIKAPEFLKHLGLETNKLNQIMVKPTLQTVTDDSIFAIGDCACCIDPVTKKPVPPRAQASHQEASLLVKSIANLINGKVLPIYHYHDYGSLISLSHYETIGNLMGRITKSLTLEGKLARFAYLSLYRLHQKALYGSWRVFVLMMANFLTRRIRPRLKLH